MNLPGVFISYSHKDQKEKQKLLDHLGVLQNAGLLDVWSDDRIGAGADWEADITQAISQAKVAILLVSANFLNSRFILQKEVPELMKRRDREGLTIFPVIAHECAWRKVDWLAKMNVRPKNGAPVWRERGVHADKELTSIAEEIADIIGPTVAHRQSLRRRNLEGSIIVDLLKDDLSKNPIWIDEKTQRHYKLAEERMLNDPEAAIEFCRDALDNLPSIDETLTGEKDLLSSPQKDLSSDSSDIDAPRYSSGRIQLLLASIYLNKERNLELAEEYYIESKNEFKSRGWFPLRALAYLGLAITRRKQGYLQTARDAYQKGLDTITQEGITEDINTDVLKQALLEEGRLIEQSDSQPPPIEPEPVRKKLFNIATGARIVAEKAITDLNFLGYKDYSSYEARSSKRLGNETDLAKFADKVGVNIDLVTYILEVPKGVKTDDSLQPGDRILITEETDPENLNNKRVAVLVVDNIDNEEKLQASLRTFFRAARDHYFLYAENEEASSLIISRYGSSEETIKRYYEKYKRGGKFTHRVAFDVRISGIVKGVVRQGVIVETKEKTIEEEEPYGIPRFEPVIWKIPIVSKIAAGVGTIKLENVKDFLYLKEVDCRGANFGVTVEGDSMTDYDIASGDVALIKQQENVKDGEIAAVLIKTPHETLEVIKEYHHYEHQNHRHWFLKSGNDSIQHLVVVPEGIDPISIEQLYAEKFQADEIKIYDNAELSIAGKFVRRIPNANL